MSTPVPRPHARDAKGQTCSPLPLIKTTFPEILESPVHPHRPYAPQPPTSGGSPPQKTNTYAYSELSTGITCLAFLAAPPSGPIPDNPFPGLFMPTNQPPHAVGYAI